MRISFWALAACAMLAACGEDGGATGGPTPTDPVSPTPTPTPTPSTGGLNTSEIKPTGNATYLSSTMEMTISSGTTNQITGETSGGMTSDRSTIIDTPQFSASYTTQSGYRLFDAINAINFEPRHLVSAGTTDDPTIIFANTAYPIADYLALYKQYVHVTSILGSGSSSPVYGGVGGWQHTVSGASSRRTRLNYFAFGPATPISSMPRSGIVKFNVSGSGNYATDTDLYFFNQADTITVDFGAGTVSGTIGGTGVSLFQGSYGGLFGFGISGSFSGNSMSGPMTSSVAVASGRFHLLFIGPNAEELIVTYVGQNGRGDIVGSSVGFRNPYLP